MGARGRLGAGGAVLATYVASTLLHGLSGQLAAVLLSLGVYTWVEHSLRDKLARILDASIGARKEVEGRRKHREGSSWVILVNLIFGLLTMFHLAYLGVMFDQSSPGHRLLLGSHSTEMETTGLHQPLGGRADGS